MPARVGQADRQLERRARDVRTNALGSRLDVSQGRQGHPELDLAFARATSRAASTIARSCVPSPIVSVESDADDAEHQPATVNLEQLGARGDGSAHRCRGEMAHVDARADGDGALGQVLVDARGERRFP